MVLHWGYGDTAWGYVVPVDGVHGTLCQVMHACWVMVLYKRLRHMLNERPYGVALQVRESTSVAVMVLSCTAVSGSCGVNTNLRG